MAFKRSFTPVLDGAAVAIGDGTVRTQTVRIASGEFTPPIWLLTDTAIVVSITALPWQGVLRCGSLQVLSTAPNIIELTAHRLAAGTGSTVISCGVPLQPGQLAPGDVGSVVLFKDGAEVQTYIEALLGRYEDGSVISLLVQRAAGSMTNGTPVENYELRLGVTPGLSPASKDTGAIKDVPDGVWELPPAHFKHAVAPVWGPLLPIDEVEDELGEDWAQVDAIFEQVADHRWTTLGETDVTVADDIEAFNSYYDQPMQRIRYYARGGGIRFLERGLRQAKTYRDETIAGNYGNNIHVQNTLCLAAAYWWTGVVSYRTTVLIMTGSSYPSPLGWTSGGQSVHDGDGIPNFYDGRISERMMAWCLMSWLLGETDTICSDSQWTPLQELDYLAALCVSEQNPDGSWTEPGDNTQNQPMEALRVYGMMLYMDYRPSHSVTGLAQAIIDQADFLKTQFDGTWDTWHYLQDWVVGDARVSLAEMRALAVMIAAAYYFAQGKGVAGYTADPADALTMYGVEAPSGDADLLGGASFNRKAYTENYYLAQYVMAKAAGIGRFE